MFSGKPLWKQVYLSVSIALSLSAGFIASWMMKPTTSYAGTSVEAIGGAIVSIAIGLVFIHLSKSASASDDEEASGVGLASLGLLAAVAGLFLTNMFVGNVEGALAFLFMMGLGAGACFVGSIVGLVVIEETAADLRALLVRD